MAPALVLLPSSLGRDFGTNGPLWSLAFEVVYYALYPLWLWLRIRAPRFAFGVVPAACLALAWLPQAWTPMGAGFLKAVLLHYPIWLAGAALAERLAGQRVLPWPGWLAAAGLACGIDLKALHLHHAMAIVAAVMFGGAAVLLFATQSATWQSRWWNQALEFLGVRSYTIYIVHFPFLSLLGAAVIETQGGRPLHGWMALAGAVLTLAFGCACFEVCEKHFLHARLRIGPATQAT